MTAENDRIPIVETYRGIGIHDEQPQSRIEQVVKPEIDRVLALSDIDQLVEFAADHTNAPESRMLAAAKVEASYQVAADERRQRPAVDLDYVRAVVVGLDSQNWRSPDRYCSLFDTHAPGTAGPVKREKAVGAGLIASGTEH